MAEIDYYRKDATPVYRKECSGCRRRRYGKSRYKNPTASFKGDKCERCGFVPEISWQLDVDHIDGDHTNNHPDNLQTLCANCHRFKTWCERTETEFA